MFYTSLGWFNGFNPDSWVMYLMYALIVVFISAEAIPSANTISVITVRNRSRLLTFSAFS